MQTEETVIARDRDIADTIRSCTATDDFGRTFGEVGPAIPDKRVGIFYFLWNGQHHEGETEILDYSKCPHDENFFRPKDINAKEVHRNSFYYWGEPLFGYYNAADDWVIHKHLRLLTLSGIDFLALDATNAVTYDEVAEKLFSITCFYLDQGIPVPKLVFYLNTETKKTLQHLYERYYRPGRFRKAWYYENGKPLVIGNGQPRNPDGTRDYGENIYDLDPEIQQFFTIRPNLWPKQEILPNGVCWLDWEYPQRNIDGTMSVSVSQHTRHPFSLSVDCDADEEAYHSNWGRGYDFSLHRNIRERMNEGINFEAQWQTAIRDQTVKTAFVTGWNEWIAQKLYHYHIAKNKFSFVDTVNQEFSRDIEMMKGGYFDNFYLQNARNVRAFRYEPGKKQVCFQRTYTLCDLPQTFGRIYYHFAGLFDRDYPNCIGTERYVNATTRNHFRTLCVCDDGQTIWFRLNFDRLLGVDSVRLEIKTETKTYQIRYENGSFRLHSEDGNLNIAFCTQKDSLSFEIPLCMLGVEKDFTLKLKALDRVDPENREALYTDGDVFPLGRIYLLYHAAIPERWQGGKER